MEEDKSKNPISHDQIFAALDPKERKTKIICTLG
jgi:hypothetical protein